MNQNFFNNIKIFYSENKFFFACVLIAKNDNKKTNLTVINKSARGEY